MKHESTHPGENTLYAAYTRKSDTIRAYGWRRTSQGTETDVLADIARNLGIRDQEKANIPGSGVARKFRFRSLEDADKAEEALKAAGCASGWRKNS